MVWRENAGIRYGSRYNQDYSKYEPWIVQSKKDPKKLFCKLTKQFINKVWILGRELMMVN